MATAIYTTWFKQNAGSLDASGRDLGLTLFNRCPDLFYEENDFEGSWASVVQGLDDLLDSPHWQAPSYFVEETDGEGVTSLVTRQQAVAATAEYYIDIDGDQYLLRFVDEEVGFEIGDSPAWGASETSPTGTVITGLAIWYDGSVGDVVRPILVMIQLDRPVLLMATDDRPTNVKAPLVLSWTTPTPGVDDGQYGMFDFGTGTYGGGEL